MQTVVITGASSGIGRDAALLFNELGFMVYAGVRRSDDGDRVRGQVAHPDALRPLLLDVTDAGQVAAARDAVAAEVAPAGLTALVSNAGIAAMSGPSSCEECPLDVQQQIMDVNFFGAARVIQAFLPLLRAGRGTVVVNSALMAHTVIPFNAGYAASKAALEAWTDSLRRETASFGVRVAMVEAAYISSDLERKQRRGRDADSHQYPLETALHDAATRASRRLADRPAAAPRRVAETMVDAVRSAHPKPRRIVGAGARPIWALGCLPDRAQDAIFRVGLARLARQR